MSSDAFRRLLEREVKFIPFGETQEITLTFNEVRNVCAKKTKGGCLPSNAQIYEFMRLCRARGLNPFVGDAYLVGYDTNDGPQFSLITAIQALFKRAEVNPSYDGMKFGIIVRDAKGAIVERDGDFQYPGDTLLGGWAECYRKDRKYPMVDRLNLDVFSSGQSRWRKDPAGMIVKCAQASVLRMSFPSQVGAMFIDEEFQQQLAQGLEAAGGRVEADPRDFRSLLMPAPAESGPMQPVERAAAQFFEEQQSASQPRAASTLNPSAASALNQAIAIIRSSETPDEARESYDRLFGPDATEKWSPEDDKAGQNARDLRIGELS